MSTPWLRLSVHLKDGKTVSGTYPQIEGLSRYLLAREQPNFAWFDLDSVREGNVYE